MSSLTLSFYKIALLVSNFHVNFKASLSISAKKKKKMPAGIMIESKQWQC